MRPECESSRVGIVAPSVAPTPAGPPPQMPSYEEQMAWALRQSTLDATPAPATPPVETPTEAEMATFFAKVGGSLEQVRSATQLDWPRKRLTAGDCKVMAHLIAVKFMPVLTKLNLKYNSTGDAGKQAVRDAVKDRSGFELEL